MLSMHLAIVLFRSTAHVKKEKTKKLQAEFYSFELAGEQTVYVIEVYITVCLDQTNEWSNLAKFAVIYCTNRRLIYRIQVRISVETEGEHSFIGLNAS